MTPPVEHSQNTNLILIVKKATSQFLNEKMEPGTPYLISVYINIYIRAN